jgi:type IV secretory pathway VirB4 component
MVLDLSEVPEAQRAFHLTYLLQGILGRLRTSDHPKLVVVDEAHLLARTGATAEFLDRLVRHVRHYRTGLLLLSQSPDDFLGNEAGRSLLRNLRATLLLRLSNVSPEARRFFGLTEAEADWLPKARLPKEAEYTEGLLRSGPSHLPIAVLATREERELLERWLVRPEPAGAIHLKRQI